MEVLIAFSCICYLEAQWRPFAAETFMQLCGIYSVLRQRKQETTIKVLPRFVLPSAGRADVTVHLKGINFNGATDGHSISSR